MTTQSVIGVATTNAHKCQEIAAILTEYQVKRYADIEEPRLPIDEDGLTFYENALKKVRGHMVRPNQYVLADDSGLCVEVLDGDPGIYSARYAGESATDDDNCQKLLQVLGDQDNRKAVFVSVIALMCPDRRIIMTEGRCEGHITTEKRGEGGFGYDPIFIPDGQTSSFAQMTAGQKDAISHRRQALTALKKRLYSM